MNEKENTFRILKDEKPLVKSIWCRFGIHNWSMYLDPHEGVYTTKFFLVKRKVIFQYRYCGNCHKVDQGITDIGSVYD